MQVNPIRRSVAPEEVERWRTLYEDGKPLKVIA